MNFIKDSSTGQEIPDPPRFIDFCRGDINDNASEASEDGGYSVAQFPRPINPAIRSSSPQPSVFESHHDPNSSLARDLGHGSPQDPLRQSDNSTRQQSYPDPRGSVRGNPYQQSNFAVSAADIAQIPHDPYPPDGMTQFCRTKPPLAAPSERSAAPSPNRSASRDSTSDYSNPSSFTSYGPSSGAQSPVKQMSAPAVQEEPSPKKRGFFNSPFRRKSKRDLRNEQESSSQQQTPTATPSNRNTWAPSSARKAGFDTNSSPSRYHGRGTILGQNDQSMSPEMERSDPRTNFQLNIGNNVFDVASPDARKAHTKQAHVDPELDPIAQALAELKGVTKASSIRQSADRYAGLATPAPQSQGTSPLPGAVPTPFASNTIAGAQRGTPPPSYEQPMSRLGAPPAAHTSRAMQETTKKYLDQKQTMFNASPQHNRGQSHSGGHGQYRPPSRQGQGGMRATSPAPPRATSPRPGMYEQQQSYNRPQSQAGYNRPPSQAGYTRPPSQAGYSRAASPNPYAAANSRPRANTNSPAKPHAGGYASRGGSPSMNMPRAASPQPQYASQSRPGSRAGGGMQLTSSPGGSEYGTQRGRPQSQYYPPAAQAQGNEVGRVRSKSTAEPRQYSHDGKPIIHYGKHIISHHSGLNLPNLQRGRKPRFRC
jgi:hypothetical protein